MRPEDEKALDEAAASVQRPDGIVYTPGDNDRNVVEGIEEVAERIFQVVAMKIAAATDAEEPKMTTGFGHRFMQAPTYPNKHWKACHSQVEACQVEPCQVEARQVESGLLRASLVTSVTATGGALALPPMMQSIQVYSRV